MSINSFEDDPLSWKPILDKRKEKTNISKTLAELLEQDILQGKLLPGTKLPPQRELADFLEVGLSTVTRAFRICRQRGLVCSTVGGGTFVASDAIENSALISNEDEYNLIDLGSSTAALPINALLADSFKRMASEPDIGKLLRYDTPGGSWISRQAGVKWMEFCGYHSVSDRIIVAAGAQNALAGCLLGFFQPGDRLAVDALTYQGVLNLSRLLHLQLVALPDAQTIDEKVLSAFIQREKIKGIYVIPDYHNPTARIMPLKERRIFAEAVTKNGIILLEDGSNTLLMQHPIAPIASFAPEYTIYLAGLSKVLAPGLRGAFVDCPPAFRSRLAETLYALNVTLSPLLIHWVDRLVISGKALDVVEERKKDLKRRNALVDQILADCPGSVEGDEGSPIRWLKLPKKTSGRSFETMARAVEVQVYGAERFAVGKRIPETAVRLSVAAPVSMQQLETGMVRLRNLLQQLSNRTWDMGPDQLIL